MKRGRDGANPLRRAAVVASLAAALAACVEVAGAQTPAEDDAVWAIGRALGLDRLLRDAMAVAARSETRWSEEQRRCVLSEAPRMDSLVREALAEAFSDPADVRAWQAFLASDGGAAFGESMRASRVFAADGPEAASAPVAPYTPSQAREIQAFMITPAMQAFLRVDLSAKAESPRGQQVREEIESACGVDLDAPPEAS